MFRPGFTCLAVLWILRSCQNFYLRDSHTLRLAFPCHSVNSSSLKSSPYPERISPLGLPSSAFARHYYGISVDFSSSPYLDVSVQAVPFQYLWIQYWIMEYELHWVAPFRYLRINGCLLLPEAFRSLPRLSSAPSAKAFTLRPF